MVWCFLQVADEVLHTARIHPCERACDLTEVGSPCNSRMCQPLPPKLSWPHCPRCMSACLPVQDQTEALRAALLEVAEKSTEVDADSSRFPDGWLFSHRCACSLHIVAPALHQMLGASAMHAQVKQTSHTPPASTIALPAPSVLLCCTKVETETSAWPPGVFDRWRPRASFAKPYRQQHMLGF